MAGTFQQSINYDYPFGVPGEIVRHGPVKSHAGLLNSASAANNIFGYGFTQLPAGGTVTAGGTGVFFGIMGNPKTHASFGGAAGPLSPSFALPNQVVAEFVTYTAGMVVQLPNASTIGQQLQMSQLTGALSIPVVPGTADANNTLIPAFVEDFPQPAINNLVLVRVSQ